MKQKNTRTSGFDKDHLRLLKNASVESKFHALASMIEFAKEAEISCKKRGTKHRSVFSNKN